MTLYFSSHLKGISYPRVICTFKVVTPEMRETTETLFVDSGIFEGEFRDESKLIDIQNKYADIASPPDYWNDIDGTVRAAVYWTSRITLPNEQRCYPLQGNNPSDYMTCLDRLIEEGISPVYVGLGGLIRRPRNEINAILNYCLPKLNARNIRVHIFGLGATWAHVLKKLNPYSWDSSTPVRYAIDNILLDDTLNHHLFKIPWRGSFQKALLAQWNNSKIDWYMNNELLSQTTFEEFFE